MSVTAPTPPVTTRPAVCPFCRSQKVTTTSKSAGDNAYWRCDACGQIWNPSRLLAFRGYR